MSYVVYATLLFAFQRQVLFPGQRLAAPPTPSPRDADHIWLVVEGGTTEAWLLRPDSQPGHRPMPALMFFHGNYELIDHWLHDFDALRAMGMAVLLVEYPGYGRSEGRPSKSSLIATAVAAYDSLIARPDIARGRIVVYGRSVGGGPASELAARRPVKTLILQSTFSSIAALASDFFIPRFLIRDPFDNEAILADLDIPVLVVHGRNDGEIAPWHAERLAAASDRVTLRWYDCTHDDCPPDWPVFWDEVKSFLEVNGVL